MKKTHVTSMLVRSNQVRKDYPGIVFEERSHTWGDIHFRVQRIAGALQAFGIEDGDAVPILSMNNDQYTELFFAAPWAGGVIAPLNVRWATVENIYALNQLNAKLLVVDEAFAESVEEIVANTPSVKTVIYIGEGTTPDFAVNYEHLIERYEPVPDAGRGDDDLYAIFYTGGTTGRPKGVMISHANIMLTGQSWIPIANYDKHSVQINVGGLFHFSGAGQMWNASLVSGCSVMLPKFDPLLFMQAVEKHRVTGVILVPTMINMILNHEDFDKYDLSSLRTCTYGGSIMPEAMIKDAIKKLPNCQFVHIYAMTEVTGMATFLPWEEHSGPKAKSVGQVAPGIDLLIVDEEGNEKPRGEVGEIIVKGTNVMLGYFKEPGQTAEALNDGWMHSGDGGWMDEDGYLYIADRIKDMIITGGENVFSAEVENVIYSHDAVLECAVIGIPDDKWGETIHAIVVCHPGMAVSEEELKNHCRNHLAGYKCPRSVDLRKERLPVSPGGKIQKAELRKHYLAQQQ